MQKVAVIIPTYNERENIAPLVTEILALGLPGYIVVVDDNSPDGTGALADEMAARHPQVQVVHRPGKMGLGRAYLAGFARAFELDVDMALTMDADFSHHPRYIPNLVRLVTDEGRDIAIGSRYVPGGGTRNWGVGRQLLSGGANFVARTTLGLRAHDCTAGFRCYRRSLLETAPLDRIFSDGYSFLIELLYRCQRMGCTVGESPIIFEDRRAGQSKISKNEIARAGYTVLRLASERLLRRGPSPVRTARR
ncbi:MAG: polyprenol monophosphomannose synthase [Chloroflexi bacterium]|nr:polyprenol monophosphomannose synthase [Chloroflexota bacterium]